MKINHSFLILAALMMCVGSMSANTGAQTLMLDKQILSAASGTQESARQALRSWLDCFVNADGGAFYDMMPSSAQTKLDQWFDKLSTSPSWKADPESAKVPTSRSFLVLAFEEAKNQGGLGMDVKDSDFESVAATCQLNGNSATFNGLDGTKLTFKIEGNAWKMDSDFANNMVDGIISSVGDIN